MQIVIGVSGVKESGKSTFAKLLREMSQNRFEERALAFKLKEACAKATGMSFENFEDQNLKEKILKQDIVLDSSKISTILSEFDIKIEDKGYEMASQFIGKTFDTPRKMLQLVGTELLRSFDEEIHCNYVSKTLNEASIITDVRFENEYRFFKDRQNTLYVPVFIHNAQAEKRAKLDGHRSELEVFNFSDRLHLVNNNAKSLDEMKANVKRILGMVDFAERETKRFGAWV